MIVIVIPGVGAAFILRQIPKPAQLNLKKRVERKSFVVLYRDWSSEDLLREVHEMRVSRALGSPIRPPAPTLRASQEMEEVERQIREDAELLFKTPEGKAIISQEVAAAPMS